MAEAEDGAPVKEPGQEFVTKEGLPFIAIVWDEGAQEVSLQFPHTVFRSWQMVRMVLDQACRVAEACERAAIARAVQADAMKQQAQKIAMAGPGVGRLLTGR